MKEKTGPNRRDVLKSTSASLLALGAVGTSVAKPPEGDEERVKELVSQLKDADDEEAFYRSLSQKEKSLLEQGLQIDPSKVSTETTVSKATVKDSGVSSAAQTTSTTYTERNTVTGKNNFNETIIEYYHTLDWTVESGDVVSASVSTDGSGFLFWQYERDIDPEQKTVQPTGCASTKSGLFRYCNEIQGVGYCTKEYRTRITSSISGFPSGKSSETDEIVQCGTDCTN